MNAALTAINIRPARIASLVSAVPGECGQAGPSVLGPRADMNYNLKNRSLLALDEWSPRDMHLLLDMAHDLKRDRCAGREQPQLRDKNIALLCDPAVMRSRCDVEVAAIEQGAHVAVIDLGDSPFGERDLVKDTARMLGRLYDAIEYCGFEPAIVNELTQHAGVPVWNGLTRPLHPTQILADYMTMQEHCPNKSLAQMRLAYLGDAGCHIGESLLQGAALMGIDFRIGAPPSLWPPQALIEVSQQRAQASGACLHFTASAHEAVQGVDFICTDVWAAQGEPDAVWAERIAQLQPYRVNAARLASSGNPAVKFLHCRPLSHDRDRRRGEAILRRFGSDGLEVTDEVVESPASVVRDQAENRLHTIKALLVATLA